MVEHLISEYEGMQAKLELPPRPRIIVRCDPYKLWIIDIHAHFQKLELFVSGEDLKGIVLYPLAEGIPVDPPWRC
jgi:hypothetical protein